MHWTDKKPHDPVEEACEYLISRGWVAWRKKDAPDARFVRQIVIRIDRLAGKAMRVIELHTNHGGLALLAEPLHDLHDRMKGSRVVRTVPQSQRC